MRAKYQGGDLRDAHHRSTEVVQHCCGSAAILEVKKRLMQQPVKDIMVLHTKTGCGAAGCNSQQALKQGGCEAWKRLKVHGQYMTGKAANGCQRSGIGTGPLRSSKGGSGIKQRLKLALDGLRGRVIGRGHGDMGGLETPSEVENGGRKGQGIRRLLGEMSGGSLHRIHKFCCGTS